MEVTEEGDVEESGEGRMTPSWQCRRTWARRVWRRSCFLGLARERVARAGVEGSGGERDVW